MRTEKTLSGKILFLLLSSMLLLTACSSVGEEPVQLRLALLPVLDTLPIHVALEEGLFEEQGISVEVIPVSSAPERDQLIAAGKADGMLNEIVSTLFYNQEEVRVQIVRVARAAGEDAPLFRILVSPESGIKSPEELKGVEIGISEGTVIEYVTDRILQGEGFTAEEIAKIPVPKIPDRLALLGSSEIDAAVLPDPLSSLAVANGASVVIDDSSYPQYSLSVLAFRVEVLEAHPGAVQGFLAAVEEAVERINQDPERYAGLLSEKELVPPPVLGEYQLNPFPPASVPSREQWQDALNWAQEKGLLSGDVPYSSSVNSSFLP